MLQALIPRINWQDWIYRIMSKFQRMKRPQALPINLHRKRIYILPTRFGIFFGLFLLVMLMGALNYNNNMALMLTFLLGGLALLSPLYTVRNLADVQVLQVSAQPVFAGQTATFVLTLMNPSSTERPMVWGNLEGPTDFVDLPANGLAELPVCGQTQTRGWMLMRRTRLETSYPVGMFFSWAWVEPDTRVLVYPRPENHAPPLPTGDHPALGQPESKGDEEWSGLRDYQAGDPSRIIAWKVVARTDEMVSKTFADHRSEELILDFHGLQGLDTERRLSRLARWVLEADQKRLKYALSMPGETIGPAAGDQHKHRCLKTLAEYDE